MQVEPLRPRVPGPRPRVEVMDEQGLGAALLFPTLGCGVEEALRDDVDGHDGQPVARSTGGSRRTGASTTGPHHRRADALAGRPRRRRRRGRLADRAGRAWCTSGPRRCPAPTAPAGRSATSCTTRSGPGWPRRRSRWPSTSATAATAAVRRGLGRVSTSGSATATCSSQVLVSDRAIHDTMASLVVHGVFTATRRCGWRASRTAPTGCTLLAKRLRKQANQTPWVFVEDPLDTLRRHVWVTPYLEEDLGALAELIGVDRILFGSDWPHGEGVAQPLDFAKELGGFDETHVRRIMRDNCLELLGAARRATARVGRPEAPTRQPAARRAVGRGHGLAGGQLGPRPHRRRLVEGRRRAGWTAPTSPPSRAGRGLTGGRRPWCGRRSPSTAPCARPAGSGC